MKKKHVSFAVSCVLIFCLTLFVSACGGDSSSSAEGEKNLASVLKALGISTSVKERTDPEGKTVRTDYNPMGKKTTRLNKIPEIYVAGSSVQGSISNDSLIDPTDDSVLTYDPDGAWASSCYFKTAGADTDGDGHDEIITIVFDVTNHKLVLKEAKYNKTSDIYSRRDVAEIQDSEIIQSAIGYRADAIGDIAAGDIDGDGREEILVTYLSNILIFDDGANNYRLLMNKKIPAISSNYQLMKIKTGDFDQDGKDEIVITNGTGIPNNGTTAQYTIYDDITNDPSLSSPIISNQPITAYFTSQIIDYGNSTPVIGTTKSLEAANMAIGDFNGDGLPDVAFAGNSLPDKGCYLFILKTSMDRNSRPKFEFIQTVACDSSYELAAPPIDAGDINGNGKDDIVMWKGVYSLNSTNMLSSMGVMITPHEKAVFEVRAGDTDGDCKSEVVLLCGLDSLLIFEYDSASQITQCKTIALENKNTLTWGTISLPGTKKPCEVIEFSGHDVKFTDPRIIAVLAAPPYYGSLDGADRDTVQPYLGNTGTSFGKSNSVQSEESNTFGFSVSFTFGSSVDCPLWGSAASAEIKNTISNSFDWTSASSKEISCTYKYTNGTDDDMVIFSVIPFDVYYYKVLNSTDPNVIGKTVTISLPKKPITTSQSVSFYNANNGNYFDIDEDVLVHRVGEPFSYLTSFDMLRLQSENPTGLYIPTSYEQTVGEGTSATTLSMQSTETKSKNFSYNLGLSNEVEAVAVGVLVGREIGFNYGYSYSTSVSNQTEIEGQVANIAAPYYRTDRLFTWGLMAYPYEDSDSEQKFDIITYWVNRLE